MKSALAREAQALGFDCIGVTDPDATGEAGKHFQKFLEAGAHGDMDWLAANPERRMDPRVLWPGVRSIIMLGVNYGPRKSAGAARATTRGAISAYAQGDDYHDVIKKRLKEMARWLAEHRRRGKSVRRYRAVMEKPLAQAAGFGWQGKHTNLVSREFGSWLFLGAIFTASELPRDAPDIDHCGTCTPARTSARPRPFRALPARCATLHFLSHHREQGPDPARIPKSIGNRIYGCDDCLAVCPWNKFAQQGREAKLAARAELRAPSLAELARLDDAAFRALFAKSPVKRIGRDRFVRNVLIAIGNSGDASLAREARLLDDDSALVRGAAVWALSQLMTAVRSLHWQRMPGEVDRWVVRGEWRDCATGP